MKLLIEGKEIYDAVQTYCKHRESEKGEPFPGSGRGIWMPECFCCTNEGVAYTSRVE